MITERDVLEADAVVRKMAVAMVPLILRMETYDSLPANKPFAFRRAAIAALKAFHDHNHPPAAKT